MKANFVLIRQSVERDITAEAARIVASVVYLLPNPLVASTYAS